MTLKLCTERIVDRYVMVNEFYTSTKTDSKAVEVSVMDSNPHAARIAVEHNYCSSEVVSSGGAPTPAGTSVLNKHIWDMGMGYLWLNGWGIYQ